MKTLAACRIAVPESRELDLFAGMLESHGATVLRCPLVSILDVPDPAPVEAWLRRLIANEFDDLVLLTGEGLRRLRGVAERAGIEAPFREAVAKVRKIARGPKPVKALREMGLNGDVNASAPTTQGVVDTLKEFDLRGRTIGVQLYGQEPNLPLISFLEGAGAKPAVVAPYYYAPDVDTDRVADVIAELAAGRIDVIAFTSASQVERLWKVAADRGCVESLAAGMKKVHVAAVGPVVADSLTERGVAIALMPEKSFFMRPLVNAILASFGTGE